MTEDYGNLIEAHKEYLVAKNKLYSFYGSVRVKYDGQYYIYKCADCGGELLRHDFFTDFGMPLGTPIFHCGKLRVGDLT